MSKGITYHNKDVEFKLLSEIYKEKSFEAYGLHIPKIKEVLPTNLPEIAANELRMDNMFLLEDDTYAIVDYESEDKPTNRIKYVNYIGRVMKRYYTDKGIIPNIRMIVIYTGDVEKASALYQIECMTLKVENVFVRDLPAEEIYQTVRQKIEHRIKLSEKELMQLIILPLAERGMEEKQRRTEQVMELANKFEDRQEQLFVLSGLLVSTDKFINHATAQSIRRRINMTKVGRMIYEDGMAEGIMQERKQVVENMFRENLDLSVIQRITGMTIEEIEQIRRDTVMSQS